MCVAKLCSLEGVATITLPTSSYLETGGSMQRASAVAQRGSSFRGIPRRKVFCTEEVPGENPCREVSYTDRRPFVEKDRCTERRPFQKRPQSGPLHREDALCREGLMQRGHRHKEQALYREEPIAEEARCRKALCSKRRPL